MSYFKPEPKKSLFFNLKKNPPTRRSSIFTLAQAAHSIEFTTTKDFHLESHSKSFFFSSSSVSTVFSSRSVTERRQFDDRGLVSTSRTRARFLLSLFRCSSVGCRGGTGAPRGMPSVHSTLTPVSLTVGLDLEIIVCFWHF